MIGSHFTFRMLAPLAYWRLNHPERLWGELGIAVFAAILLGGYFYLLPVRPSLIGEKGLLTDIKDMLGLLFPFFVGALAAVATYGRKELDEVALHIELHEANKGWRDISRREFVCIIFGYCAWLSLILYLCIVVGRAVAPSLLAAFPKYLEIIRTIGFCAFIYLFIHMIHAAFWGLYYLTFRVGQPPSTP